MAEEVRARAKSDAVFAATVQEAIDEALSEPDVQLRMGFAVCEHGRTEVDRRTREAVDRAAAPFVRMAVATPYEKDLLREAVRGAIRRLSASFACRPDPWAVERVRESAHDLPIMTRAALEECSRDVVTLLAAHDALEEQRDALRAKLTEMHRRAQRAEAVADRHVDELRTRGESLGRALAGYAAERARGQVERLRAVARGVLTDHEHSIGPDEDAEGVKPWWKLPATKAALDALEDGDMGGDADG